MPRCCSDRGARSAGPAGEFAGAEFAAGPRRSGAPPREAWPAGAAAGLPSGPHGDGLDLYARPQWQGGYGEGGPGGQDGAGDVAGVDLVDGLEVGDVGQQDGGLDDVGPSQVGGGEDGADIGQGPLGLGLDAAVDEGPGGRVERDLPRDVDESAAVPPGGHGLEVGANNGQRDRKSVV